MKYLCVKNTQTVCNELPNDFTKWFTIGEWYEVICIENIPLTLFTTYYAVRVNNTSELIRQELLDILFKSITQIRLERLNEILMH